MTMKSVGVQRIVAQELREVFGVDPTKYEDKVACTLKSDDKKLKKEVWQLSYLHREYEDVVFEVEATIVNKDVDILAITATTV